MIYPIYSIRDIHTGFLAPQVDTNDAAAIRNFEHAILNTDGLMHSHPKDFDLFKVGSFDTENGQLDLFWPIVLVLEGASVSGI